MEVIVPFVNPSRIFHAVCAYWLMSSAGFSATADGHHASRQAKTMPSARPNRARRWAFSMDENLTLIYLSGGATCIPLLRCREATPLRVTERLLLGVDRISRPRVRSRLPRFLGVRLCASPPSPHACYSFSPRLVCAHNPRMGLFPVALLIP